jgi:hypothetical protein
MSQPKIDFGESHWVRTNPDTFGKEPFSAVKDKIQPRNPELVQPAEFRVNDEALRREMDTYQRVRAEQTEVIRQATATIRDAEAKIQVARHRLAVAQGY